MVYRLQNNCTTILSDGSSEVITMKIETVAIVGRGALGILYGAHFTEKLGKQAVSFVAGEDRIERYMSSQPVCNGRV